MSSHQKAQAAWDRGSFNDEVVAVLVPQRKADPLLFARDEGIRGDTTLEPLAGLRL